MKSLYLRNLFFTILQPGLVAGAVPYWILQKWPGETTGLLPKIAGGLIGLLGFAVMLACILRFAGDGQGTISPADPTKNLVIKGLYRYSRNPMYVGVLGILIGETIFFGSGRLALYTVAIFIIFHLFVILREEPRLKKDFGAAYKAYRERVRRWI